jgi:hypothetical protein
MRQKCRILLDFVPIRAVFVQFPQPSGSMETVLSIT